MQHVAESYCRNNQVANGGSPALALLPVAYAQPRTLPLNFVFTLERSDAFFVGAACPRPQAISQHTVSNRHAAFSAEGAALGRLRTPASCPRLLSHAYRGRN